MIEVRPAAMNTHAGWVEETRAHYRPERITTLFVGESPPHSGKFFYYGNTALAHHMSFAMRRAGLLDDGDFPDRFKAYGWDLDDLVLEPVTRMPPSHGA